MAAPSAPSASDLVSEAFKQAGVQNPASALTTRATNIWLEEIKNDIWTTERRLRSLYVNAVAILTKGQSKYSNPSDFWSDLSMSLMNGDHTDTAQAATASSITFASDEDITQADAVGKEVVITAGTGKGSISQITAYNTTTKVATTTPAWQTTPDSSSTYLVINWYRKLDRIPIWELDEETIRTETGKPEEFYPIGDEDDGEFVLDRPPDSNYPVMLRYFVNLMQLDLTSTRITTLYQRWRNVWMTGLIYRARKNEDDVPDMINIARSDYISALRGMIDNERMPGTYESDVGTVQLTL